MCTMFKAPTRVHIPNSVLSTPAVFVGFKVVTNRRRGRHTQTDHATLHIATAVLQPDNSRVQSTLSTETSTDARTHTHPFNGPLSGTTWVNWYQKGTTNLDFTQARDSEWQWHQLGHMQVCTSLQTDNHDSTQPLIFLQAGCPSCHPTNSVKALKATTDARNTHARTHARTHTHTHTHTHAHTHAHTHTHTHTRLMALCPGLPG